MKSHISESKITNENLFVFSSLERYFPNQSDMFHFSQDRDQQEKTPNKMALSV